MPGFTQEQLNYNALNGNNVAVLIGDQTIAFAQSTDHTTDFGTETQYGIGSAKPQEIQQLKFSPTITLTQFALTDTGKQRIQGNTQNLISLLANNQFNLHIVSANGASLYTYVGCVCTNYGQNIPANAIITENLNFQAMDVLDSSGKSILNGTQAFSL